MPTARKHQVSLDATPYYHCISRCVRRAFLCGYDQASERDFNHRKQWLVDHMHQLADIFAIRICAYAIMSNHYHLVLFVDKDLALSWSDTEIVNRWADLFPMSKAAAWRTLGLDLNTLNDDQYVQLQNWREQLYDISWFMRKLNEFIARQANKEDECTGRFWEGRFKSQALLDESALLSCMAYVDLNPIRAGLCQTPETSDYTSIQERIESYQQQQPAAATLSAFEGNAAKERGTTSPLPCLPCTQEEYFELVDVTGRLVRAGKAGAIPDAIAPILSRLKINPDTWLETVLSLGHAFAGFIGRSENIQAHMVILQKQRVHGLKSARRAFRKVA
jgi:REP element-mobilizing transposase RayT